MQKLDSLRAAVTAAIPLIAKKPDALKIYARKGAVVARDGRGYGFEYRFTALLELLDFAGDPDALMASILLWIRRWEPTLLQRASPAEAFRFDVDVLGPKAVDVIVELDLTESVASVAREGGGFDLVHVTEPRTWDIHNPILDELLDPPRPKLEEIWLGDVRLVPPPEV